MIFQVILVCSELWFQIQFWTVTKEWDLCLVCHWKQTLVSKEPDFFSPIWSHNWSCSLDSVRGRLWRNYLGSIGHPILLVSVVHIGKSLIISIPISPDFDLKCIVVWNVYIELVVFFKSALYESDQNYIKSAHHWCFLLLLLLLILACTDRGTIVASTNLLIQSVVDER